MSSPLGEYLRARRTLVQPEDVGLERDHGRKVSGLRREEVASLAAISPEYYLRLEQGYIQIPSDQVLNGLARALRLDPIAASYMRRLAHAAVEASPPWESAPPDRLAELEIMLGQWRKNPAWILDRNMDIVLSNRMMRVLSRDSMIPGASVAERMFSDVMRKLTIDWEPLAEMTVAALRYTGHPDDPRFQRLVGGLLVRDHDFRRMWARHDASPWMVGRTTHYIEPFGRFQMSFQNLLVPGTGGHYLTVFFPDPGTAGEEAMAVLAANAADPAFELPSFEESL